MPKTLFRYACDLCNSEYTDLYSASMCEVLPILEPINGLKEYNIGDEITYQCEQNLGSLFSYHQDRGRVAKKIMVRAMRGHNHQYLYFTETGHGVVWIQNECGQWLLRSPAELKKRV